MAIERSLYLDVIQEEFLHIHDIFLDEKNYMHFIEIDKTKKNENNHLVLLHGFGAGAFTYFQMA